jgi:hypothetical protein
MGILTVVSLSALLLVPPITQDQNYHDFADQRTLLGIPNFWNVVSNLPFIAVGAVGVRRFSSRSDDHRALLGDFFDRLQLVCYHWNPWGATSLGNNDNSGLCVVT